MKSLKIQTIEREFPNQWLLVEVTETKAGAPAKGVLLKASPDRKSIIEAIDHHKGKRLYFFFNGSPAPPDTAFAL